MMHKQRENLLRLLAPRHMTFIGGNDAAIAAQQCQAIGFKGPNPKRRDMAGLPCFAKPEDLPEAPDAVFLAVPHTAAVETVATLRRMGTVGVVCFTAGFGELGEAGAGLERALVEAAGDMALEEANP